MGTDRHDAAVVITGCQARTSRFGAVSCLGSVRVIERRDRVVLWRSLRSRRSHILADKGLGAHRREKRRREYGVVPGQLLGDYGGAEGVSAGVWEWQGTGSAGGEEKERAGTSKKNGHRPPSPSLQARPAKKATERGWLYRGSECDREVNQMVTKMIQKEWEREKEWTRPMC
jgi:hypothetical protein